jgi:hypothetical protein
MAKLVIPKCWYEKNEHSLQQWIENAKPYDNYRYAGLPMQIFKDLLTLPGEVDPHYKVKPEEFNPRDVFHVTERHRFNILNAAVFSLSSISQSEGQGIPRTMMGYYQQQKHLPTPTSKALIVYLAGNGIKRWLTDYYFTYAVYDESGNPTYFRAYMILSECLMLCGNKVREFNALVRN